MLNASSNWEGEEQKFLISKPTTAPPNNEYFSSFHREIELMKQMKRKRLQTQHMNHTYEWKITHAACVSKGIFLLLFCFENIESKNTTKQNSSQSVNPIHPSSFIRDSLFPLFIINICMIIGLSSNISLLLLYRRYF